ncbi:hypothetical protein DD569_28685, partial [Klebsiella pneumoniae]
ALFKYGVILSNQNIGSLCRPLSGMRAPLAVEWSTVGKWFCRMAQPADVLTRSASPPSLPWYLTVLGD